MVSLAHCLIGPPGSGKSTVAQLWQAADSTVTIISPDTIRAQLYGDSGHQGYWPDIEAQIHQSIQLAIANHQTIIYDATNVRRIWRQSILRHEPEHLHWLGWIMPTPLEQCLAWNRSRCNHRPSRQVPEAVIYHHWHALHNEPPDLSEGFVSLNPVPQLDNVWQIETLLRISHTLQQTFQTKACDKPLPLAQVTSMARG